MNIKLPKQKMFNILFGDDEVDRIVEDTICGHTRWSIVHKIIFSHDGKFYQTTYSSGATEYQDEHPWDGVNEVECQEVKQVEKTVKVWEAVA